MLTSAKRPRSSTQEVAPISSLPLRTYQNPDAARHVQEVLRAKPVGIGLGPGRATLQFCRFLSLHLKFLAQGVKLRLVAITASGPEAMLDYAPASFLNLLPEQNVERQPGRFAETLARTGLYNRTAEQ